MIKNVPCIRWELENILRLMSLWPDSKNKLACLFIGFSWIITIPFQLMYFYELSNNVTELMSSLFDVANEFALLFRFIVAWIHRKILISLVVEMSEDWKQSKLKETRETRTAFLFTRGDLYFYCGAMLLLLPQVVINYFTNGVDKREFILNTIYPFEDHQSPVYELIIVTQFIHIILVGCAEFFLQALMISVVCHLGVQYNIMNEQIIKFIADAQKEKILEREKNLMAGLLVQKHQKNISFAERIEEAFVFISLFQCANSVASICCCSLVFVMTDDPIEILRFSVFLIMRLAQTFVLCYAGEYLTDKNSLVADIVYHSDWYELHPKYIKILQLMMVRAQKPLVLTAGKFVVLTSETFTVILKTSASYISVLRVIYK
uniref:Odorant receptor n=1 Tax=Meteorus pulchricornis TaxID=51522 RepID=A0A1S5VFT4_9HYME|nr:olfactory receptor 86 [Meteorus pulchricornis]